METRSIGKLDASVVGLGCNNFGGRIDEAATKQAIVMSDYKVCADHRRVESGMTVGDEEDTVIQRRCTTAG